MAVPSKRPCTCRRQVPPGGTDVANSHQANPRHTWVIAYRCHLPVLTGFTRPSCAGPSCQHRLRQAVPKGTGLGQEFNLATADCEYRAPLSPHLARPNSTKNGGESGIRTRETEVICLLAFQASALGQLSHLSTQVYTVL